MLCILLVAMASNEVMRSKEIEFVCREPRPRRWDFGCDSGIKFVLLDKVQ
jgi:hypothetical protein